jgi:rod shape determining protein RodA
VDYQSLTNAAYPMYVLTALVLGVLILFGTKSTGGSIRWFDLGFFHFQPSELAKLVYILVLARYLADHDRQITRLRGLLPPLAMVGLLMALILKQPDLGTALIMLPIAFIMLFVAGAKVWHLAGIILAGLVSTPLLWRFMADYQKRRLFTFLNPEMDSLGAGYNSIQSMIAVGTGGWLGKGWLQGTHSLLNFVPMNHTDFIFAVVAEEWGLLGCLALLMLFLGLLLHCVKIATKAKDLTGTLLCTGIIAMITTQLGVNVGMTVGLLPVTGLTLPFVSYGGSSLLLMMICTGIMLNIRAESVGYR